VHIPFAALKPETLRAVLEEFVTREGTEYGEHDISLDGKIAMVMTQLNNSSAVILFDEESGTCTVASAADAQSP